MKETGCGGPLLTRIAWAFTSVPILVKILGIGAVLTVCFGVIMFTRTRARLLTTLNEVLADRTISETELLAASLERSLSVGDVVAAKQTIDHARSRHADVAYIVVRGADGKILCHTFDGSVPDDLVPVPSFNSFPGTDLRVLDAGPAGLVFEAMRPVVGGHAGYVQLGWSDALIAREFVSLRGTILGSLAFCSVFGMGLALILSLAITYPIRRLAGAARQIRRNDLQARADLFSGDEIGALAANFNEMAGALEAKERARAALVEKLISSQEDERKTISRDLHDQIGQSLLALLVDMRSQSGTEAGRALCRDFEARVEDVVDEVRRVSKGMRPVALDHYGLSSALRNHAEEVSARHGVAVSYETNASDELSRLPEPVEISLYRVAQEAVTNAVRHAHPRHVSLILLRTPDSALLLVEDDGDGFDPGAVALSTGLGLLGMEERISWLGGELDVVSGDGDGTTVRARVPVRSQTAEEQA